MIDTEIKYKKTGLDWMPEVPEHWKLWKVSRAFQTIGSGTTPESGNSSYYEGGTINWINTGDLNDGFLESCEKRITQKAFDEYSTLKIYKKGTLLIAMYGATIGKVSLLNIDGCTNQACCALSDSEVLRNEFAFYWFLCNKPNIVRLSYGGGQPNISQDVIKQLRIPTPPLSEQDEIVQYIKAHEEKINLFIQKKQRFIELLKEQRQSVITKSVTNGIRKDVGLKETGIDWLGEIPINWEIRRLKRVSKSIQTGSTPKSENAEIHFDGGDINWFTPGDIKDLFIHNSNRKITQKAIDDGVVTLFPSKSVLVIGIGGTLGKVSMIEVDGGSNQQINAVTFNDGVLPEFGLYYLSAFEAILKSISNAATLAILTQSDLKDMLFILPPIEEQKQIVAHIKTETATIDTAITKAEREIELIREYKEAMIAEAVMGKRK